MTLGDLDLLVLGIAFETDDLHAVEQRLGQVQAVGRAHEHDIRQVDVEFEVVILELGVLFGIEHLEQGRCRIAAEILAELVDLVEQEQRVGRPPCAGWSRSCPAASRCRCGGGRDLGLVTHAAQRLADELAPGRLGDRLAQRGLAHARRAHEAQDRPLSLLVRA
jgi:hypothetical protein